MAVAQMPAPAGAPNDPVVPRGERARSAGAAAALGITPCTWWVPNADPLAPRGALVAVSLPRLSFLEDPQ
ncbi:hypothetical protein GGD81_004621 [Rhodobium orientis]|uniref:Uncharacterized protein n=1 Tax=Rhodobium orientis TaxID=34017 RepID=A0A327JE29_9HYPH|nr:hypothetical protein [Rhodobium orientis]MBB4305541.1 hypothetical protein [Rhodobium orientis]MBK5949137.1 hypothetical protein [Rhodobium orientis]RAI24680.1 hypothetical protein CH339_21650 [Rhodobium orientis]